MNLAVLRLYKRSNRRMRVYVLAALLLLAGAAALSLILAGSMECPPSRHGR